MGILLFLFVSKTRLVARLTTLMSRNSAQTYNYMSFESIVTCTSKVKEKENIKTYLTAYAKFYLLLIFSTAKWNSIY